MAKELAANVSVGGVTYEAGSVPPAEVAELITNPKAWGESVEDDSKPAKKAAAKRSSSK